MILRLVSVTVRQRLQHHPACIIILVLQISDLCLIHSFYQIASAIVLVVRDAQIHMNHIRQKTVLIAVLHGSSHAVLQLNQPSFPELNIQFISKRSCDALQPPVVIGQTDALAILILHCHQQPLCIVMMDLMLLPVANLPAFLFLHKIQPLTASGNVGCFFSIPFKKSSQTTVQRRMKTVPIPVQTSFPGKLPSRPHKPCIRICGIVSSLCPDFLLYSFHHKIGCCNQKSSGDYIYRFSEELSQPARDQILFKDLDGIDLTICQPVYANIHSGSRDRTSYSPDQLLDPFIVCIQKTFDLFCHSSSKGSFYQTAQCIKAEIFQVEISRCQIIIGCSEQNSSARLRYEIRHFTFWADRIPELFYFHCRLLETCQFFSSGKGFRQRFSRNHIEHHV